MMMDPVVVLIVCKTLLAPVEGVALENEKITHHQSREWAIEDGKMQCRRLEVGVIDIKEVKGMKGQPFTNERCNYASIMLGAQWNASHQNSKYRYWRTACPVKIVDVGPDGEEDTDDDRIVGWKLPECGSRATVHCEVDSEI